MIRKVVVCTIIGVIVIGLNGCGGNGMLQVKPLEKIEQTSVPINFPKVDPVTEKKINLGKYTIETQLKSYIQRLSRFSVYKKVPSRNKMTWFKGFEARCGVDSCSLGYTRTRATATETISTSAIFDLKYVVKSNNQLIFTFPNIYSYQEASTGLLSIPPIAPLNRIEADVKNIFSNLDKIVIKMYKDFLIVGEVDTKYSEKAIYANFKRIIGEFNGNKYNIRWNSNINKDNAFAIKVNEKILPLFVEMIPYRDGFKVKYAIDIPYTISSNGKSTLTKKDIPDIHKLVEDVVNN